MARSKVLLFSLGIILLSTANAQLDVFVYGDSLSDNGNTFRGTGNKIPRPDVYWQGRYSNFAGWTDHLEAIAAQSSSSINVFNGAHGGATACPNKQNGLQGMLPPMTTQVTWFKPLKQQLNSGNPRLHIMWGGHNDLLIATQNGGSAAQIQGAVKSMLGCLQQAAVTLLEQGETLALFTLFPTRDPQQSKALDSVNLLIQQTQQGLAQKYGSDKVLLFDINAKMKDIMARFTDLGFKDLASSCVLYAPGGTSLAGSTPQSVCQNPDDLVFFDTIHPSTNVYYYLATGIWDWLNQLYPLQDPSGFNFQLQINQVNQQ